MDSAINQDEMRIIIESSRKQGLEEGMSVVIRRMAAQLNTVLRAGQPKDGAFMRLMEQGIANFLNTHFGTPEIAHPADVVGSNGVDLESKLIKGE